MPSHLHSSTRAQHLFLGRKAQPRGGNQNIALGNRPEKPSTLIVFICMCISRAPKRAPLCLNLQHPKDPRNPPEPHALSFVCHDHQRLGLSFSFSLSSHSIFLISCSANLTQTSAISLPTLQVRRVTPFRSMIAFDLAQRCCHKNSFLPIPSPGLAGMPSSLQAVLSRFLRAEVVKEERVALLPTRRGGGGGARGRVLADEGSKAGSKFDCCCILLGGFPYGMLVCQEPGICDTSGFVSLRLPRPRRVGSGGGCFGPETERCTCDNGECLLGCVLGKGG
jgi:hypothetical protein